MIMWKLAVTAVSLVGAALRRPEHRWLLHYMWGRGKVFRVRGRWLEALRREIAADALAWRDSLPTDRSVVLGFFESAWRNVLGAFHYREVGDWRIAVDYYRFHQYCAACDGSTEFCRAPDHKEEWHWRAVTVFCPIPKPISRMALRLWENPFAQIEREWWNVTIDAWHVTIELSDRLFADIGTPFMTVARWQQEES